MAIKELKTRIVLKYDSYVNWMDDSKEGIGANLILLKGELGICEITVANEQTKDPNIVPTILFKVGDGIKPFKALPWASAKAADVYSWAKASDVAYSQDNKTITFVKGNSDGTDKVITFNYVTEADVKAITDPITIRVAALEGNFGTGTGTVDTKIAALDARLDIIESTDDTKEGSIAKALKDAKDHADNKIGGTYSETSTVHAAIEAAKAAGTEAKQQVANLANGQVATNTINIAANTAAISDEVTARTNADNELSDRLDNLEAFFEAADHDGEETEGSLMDALDTLKEIQEYLNGDGTAAGSVIGRISAAEDNINDLKAEFATGGRVTTAEIKIAEHADAITTLQQLTSGYTGNGAIYTRIEAVSELAEKGITDAAAAQDDVNALATIVNDPTTGLGNTYTIANTAAIGVADLTTRMGTAEGNIVALQNIVSNGDDTNAKLRTAITELQGIVKTGNNANATLRTDLTTLSDIVKHETTGLAATKAIADDAKSKAENAQTRVADIEADYLTSKDEFVLNCGSATKVIHTATV